MIPTTRLALPLLALAFCLAAPLVAQPDDSERSLGEILGSEPSEKKTRAPARSPDSSEAAKPEARGHRPGRDSADGSICIALLSENARELDHDLPGGRPQRREPAYQFTIQVDDLAAVAMDTRKARRVGGLDPQQRHLVRARDAGELIESFYFTFEARGSLDLCLRYGPWYQTWLLDPIGRQPWCACDSQRP